MKITVDLNDSLLSEAVFYAIQNRTTLQAVIEEALCKFLNNQPFQMRRATFLGNGLHVEIQQANWSQIRSQIYEGQGG